MTQTLYELLADCTVRILSGGASGTGFFVAPGQVLTCAHVIANAQQGGVQKLPIKVFWKGQEYSAQIVAFRDPDYPDLALLQAPISDHPCVLLQGGAEPFIELYTYGYTGSDSPGASTTFACEGWAGDNYELLKFKEGQVVPGMSGSPVLNRQTGNVCGIIQFTRDRNNALGGKAMLAKVVLREFPELEEKQRQFHQQDRRWTSALTSQQLQQLHLSWLPSPVLPSDAGNAIEVFFSYAEEDTDMVQRLHKHLKQLEREKFITCWHAGMTLAGEEIYEQSIRHLNTAKIILLLISPDFMFSDYHDTVEVKRAMERQHAKEAVVIAILIRPTEDLSNTLFGKLLAFPRNRKPISKWPDKDEAFAEVAREVRDVAKRLKPASSQ